MKGYLLHIAWNQSSTEGPPSVDFDDYEVGEFERTNPRLDSPKDRFERTNPRFDNVKSKSGQSKLNRAKGTSKYVEIRIDSDNEAV
jgi:hypothetical protein